MKMENKCQSIKQTTILQHKYAHMIIYSFPQQMQNIYTPQNVISDSDYNTYPETKHTKAHNPSPQK